jgi:nucleoside-diphosphate-sugar epimerase
MPIALTGATGFVGSHILAELQSGGHEVVALVRTDADATVVAARGATPAVVNLYDRPAVVKLFSDADGAIHAASPGDATSAELDAAVADAAIESFEGSGKPYAHISGVWVYGSSTSISEESPFDPPAMVAWKEPIERRVLDAGGMRGIVPVSSVAYGDGGGALPGLLLGSPRDADGKLIMVGSGQQHWSTVHVADVAAFFRLVLESDTAHGYYLLGDGLNPTVTELTEAAAVAVGAPGAVPGSEEEARGRCDCAVAAAPAGRRAGGVDASGRLVVPGVEGEPEQRRWPGSDPGPVGVDDRGYRDAAGRGRRFGARVAALVRDERSAGLGRESAGGARDASARVAGHDDDLHADRHDRTDSRDGGDARLRRHGASLADAAGRGRAAPDVPH